MLFKDILKEKTGLIRPQFEKLLEVAFEKQSHLGDLLLLSSHGHYDSEVLKFPQKLSPFIIGSGEQGQSEITHYRLIDDYRKKNVCEFTSIDYLNKLNQSFKEFHVFNDMNNAEGLTIQNEMMLYIKIWESDMMLKKFHQLSRILNGDAYDWYFEIPKPVRGNNSEERRKIWKAIKERIKIYSQELSDVINSSNKPQVRNSIAHSNYSFLGRDIHLGNYIREDKYSQLKVISFKEWTDIFHNTIVFYNEYIRFDNLIIELYSSRSNSAEIRIIQEDGKQSNRNIYYNPLWKDWEYKHPPAPASL